MRRRFDGEDLRRVDEAAGIGIRSEQRLCHPHGGGFDGQRRQVTGHFNRLTDQFFRQCVGWVGDKRRGVIRFTQSGQNFFFGLRGQNGCLGGTEIGFAVFGKGVINGHGVFDRLLHPAHIQPAADEEQLGRCDLVLLNPPSVDPGFCQGFLNRMQYVIHGNHLNPNESLL